jgi:UDP-N-acetyl-2-amino-2-deoxyglucuronate dehydrogenase
MPQRFRGIHLIIEKGGAVKITCFAVNKIDIWSFIETLPGDEDVMERYSLNPANL